MPCDASKSRLTEPSGLRTCAEAGAAMGRSTIADVQELRKQIAQATAAIDAALEQVREARHGA